MATWCHRIIRMTTFTEIRQKPPARAHPAAPVTNDDKNIIANRQRYTTITNQTVSQTNKYKAHPLLSVSRRCKRHQCSHCGRNCPLENKSVQGNIHSEEKNTWIVNSYNPEDMFISIASILGVASVISGTFLGDRLFFVRKSTFKCSSTKKSTEIPGLP